MDSGGAALRDLKVKAGHVGSAQASLLGDRILLGKSLEKTRGRCRRPGLSDGANLRAAAWGPESHFLRLLPTPGLEIFKKCVSGNLEDEKSLLTLFMHRPRDPLQTFPLVGVLKKRSWVDRPGVHSGRVNE